MREHWNGRPQGDGLRPPAVNGRELDILIVDDKQENLVAAQAALSELGQRLHAVGSGEDALRFLLQQRADLILLDVRMPTLDGFETAALIRKRVGYERTPILFLTADIAPESLARGYAVGAADYIQKPIEAKELCARVGAFVRVLRGEGLDEDTPSVLLVSNEPSERLAVECALSGVSAKVVSAASAAEALRSAAHEPCAAILVGSLSASGDPFETALALRNAERLQDVPIVFLSRRDRELSSRFRGYAIKTADYLISPVDPALLRAKVSLYVELLRRSLRVERQELRLRELEQARAVAAIVESEKRFESLIRAMDELVYTIDATQRVTGVFGQHGERPDAPGRRLLGQRLQDVWGGASAAVHERAQERALAGEPTTYEWEADERNYQTSLVPIRDARGQVTSALGVARDVTEQRTMQLQLMQADRMASMGMLAAGVAHEVNNPLTAVLGYLQLMEGRLRRMEQEAGSPGVDALKRDLALAVEGAERIAGVVADLRLFSRKPDDTLGPVDVQAVLESTLAIAANELRQRAVVVRDYDQVPPVHASAARLSQVFLNLLINAAQAIPEGQVSRNRVRVVTRAAGERVHVSIEDSGSGMAPAVLEKLFSPFFTTKPPGIGTGLGLSICKRLIEDCGGEIRIESQQGRGTQVHLSFSALPKEGRAAGSSKLELEEPSVPRARLLVIDDEPSIARLLEEVLGQVHEVTSVTSTEQALALLREGARFDLILCDLIMPEHSGIDLFGALDAIDASQKERVVFMTGGAFTQRTRDFLARVHNPRLEKPLRPKELTLEVARLLRMQPERAAGEASLGQ